MMSRQYFKHEYIRRPGKWELRFAKWFGERIVEKAGGNCVYAVWYAYKGKLYLTHYGQIWNEKTTLF